MGNVTLKQIAEKLGFSVATVSRALNDSYEINIETKKRIKQLAKELNYQPNPFASSLRRNKSKTIALIIPDISNHFFSLVIKGVETISQNKDYHILIYDSRESFLKEVSITKHLISGRVDGVLISASSETEDITHLQAIIDRAIPLVLFDRVFDDLEAIKIVSNDFESSYEATEHLIKAGCKKIAFLKVGENLSINAKRFNGYKEALKNNNVSYSDDLVIVLTHDEEKNFKIIKGLMLNTKPDGIFASVEHLAINCYDVFKSLAIKIPEEVKILSYSNLNVARHLNPALTTISQSAQEMGETAANLIIAQIESKVISSRQAKTIEIKSELLIRNSTKNG